jgi:hypothetical protein
MATKAERFRYEEERSGARKQAGKKPPRKRPSAPSKSARKSKEHLKSAAQLKAKQLLTEFAPTTRHDAAEARERHRGR